MTETLRDLFREWINIQPHGEGIFFIGNISTGKSTLIHLLRRELDNVVNQQLQQKGDGKFVYEGQINTKVTQPCTIYPKKWHLNQLNADLIEVPARTVESKKRPNWDRILNILGIFNSIRSKKFVFLLDAKHTAGNLQNWKKLFKCITDHLQLAALSQEFFHSVLLVVSKGKSDIDQNTVANRLQLLQGALKSVGTDFQRNQREMAFLDSLKAERNIRVFSKAVKNTPEITRQELINIGETIKKLKRFESGPQVLTKEPLKLNQQEEGQLESFNQQLRRILELLSRLVKELLQTNRLEDSVKKLEAEIKQTVKTLPSTYPEAVKKLLANSKDNKPTKRTIPYSLLVKVYLELEALLDSNPISQKKESYSLNEFLMKMSACGVFDFTELTEIGLALAEYCLFQKWFGPFVKDLDYASLLRENLNLVLGSVTKKVLRRKFIEEGYIPNQPKSFYVDFLDNLKRLFPEETQLDEQEKKQIQILKLKSRLQSIDPQQALNDFPFLWNEHKQYLRSNSMETWQIRQGLTLYLAKILNHLGQFECGALLFQSAQLYHSAIQSWSRYFMSISSLKGQQKKLVKFLELLHCLGLQEQGLKFCYKLRQKLLGDRQLIFLTIKETFQNKEERLQKIFKETEGEFLNLQKLPQFSQELFDRIDKYANSINPFTKKKIN